ncbi:Crp/Fnr family transcriptional regulator [Bernardetia sp. OM2101]|uniref:Crp/Fnr family transcriptional regulator n=1 Tax=Bernardetia sp. OM2101 TaxID=3344876 RepID=UPI0035D079F8
MKLSEEHFQFLKKFILKYYSVDDESIMLLDSIANVQYINNKDFLLTVGQTAKTLYLLYSGSIIAYFICEDGKIYHKNIFLEGSFVGSTVSMLTNKPSEFSLEAIEDCTVISFDYNEYKKLIEKDIDLKNFYIAYLEKNWVIDKEKREIDIITKDATTRYVEFMEQYPNIEKRIPLHYIASNLGITPTQLSRIRNNLKK